MKKFNKILILALSCGVITVAASGMALADPVILSGQPAEKNENGPSSVPEDDGSSWATATMLSGPVLQVNDEYILINSTTQNGEGPQGMVSLRVDPDLTLIVSANDGTPMSLSDIEEGEVIYAYVGAAMTLSLPPQISVSMVIVDTGGDGSIPVFTKVASLTDNGDGTYKLAVAGGDTYTVPSDCRISPYRTRNIVTLSDLSPGANCLIWPDAENKVSRIVIIQE